MRLALLLASLAAAFGLAVLTSQTPKPVPALSPATEFSAVRAMTDVRHIARAPHPIGSIEHARVQAYLLGRLTDLGLSPSLQSGALSPAAISRMEKRGDDAAGLMAVNLVGVLPGRRPELPAVLMMAHYDSAPGSPGAADDASGVAAILESIQAIKARGPADRTLIVLLTDAEELNLDGARAFFSEHPLRDKVGMVVNLEARGGGGRAMMFETGPGNAQTISQFARATRDATGGPSSNALTVFVYRLMPNGTDMTIAVNRGVAGVNLAFIGRPDQYHAPTSTPAALDQGSLQHVGSLALEAADGFLRAAELPKATYNAVYADVFGLFVLRHPPVVGWLLLGLAALLTGFAGWGARHGTGLSRASVLKGVTGGVWLLAAGVVAAQAVRVLGGPVGKQIDTPELYYTLLRRLPWMEAGAGLAVLAAVLVLFAGRAQIGRRFLTLIIFLAAALALALGGPDPLVVGAAIVAIILTLCPQGEDETPWGGWLGLIIVTLTLGLITQIAAPEAALLFIWPGLAAAVTAAATVLISARLAGLTALIPAAVMTLIVGGWLLAQAHGVFLGIGMDLPGALGLFGLLIAMLARPLAPVQPLGARTLAVIGAVGLILGGGLSLAAQSAQPAPAAPPSKSTTPS